MNSDTNFTMCLLGCLLFIFTLIFLFAGKPDIHDKLILIMDNFIHK